METRLKQRVVGAFLLTAVAIVILPVLLDGSAEDRARVTAVIPDAPGIDLKKISIRDIREKMDQMERASASQLPMETVDEDSYEQSGGFLLDENQLPVSWSLQLGSFRDKDNAVNLRAKLREANYHSYILYSRVSEGETWRVLVGPMVKKSALLELAGEIERSFDLKGQVVRYRVEDDSGQLGG